MALEENEGLKPTPEDKEIIKEIDASNEKDFLQGIKKKNKGFLVDGLSVIQKENIAKWIKKTYDGSLDRHKELCGKIDEWDEVYRMERKEVQGSDGDMPNYRTPLSTVSLEVIHAQEMNVFFTPKDVGNVIPTEAGDIPKVNKLSRFMNWSMDNEMKLFENCDRLWHSSDKNGETPYIIHWVKEYGTEIVREVVQNPADPSKPLIDPDTQQPIFQEREEQKLLYNAPKMEVFSRKDYIQPENAVMGKTPEWEIRLIRINFDQYLRDELQGKMYKGSIDEIKGWGEARQECEKEDYEGNLIPTGQWEKEFVEFYGRMRIQLIKSGDEDDQNEVIETKELEDEFIAIVDPDSGTLCSLRRNKFPLKMRPIGMDYFMPDDEGRRAGMGVMEFMESLQKSYDALYNLFIQGVTNANNPIIFFSPTGNQRDEKMRIQNGYMYPTQDPKSLNVVQLPSPDQSLNIGLELINQWAQLLFGISDFRAGIESRIDPDAPAKKAEIVVAQGNVRMNLVIKRRNATLQDIFMRWYLLYKDNLPPNKWMRIVGDSKDNPWEFREITLSDFALKSLPDFELTGNVLNSNKALEAQKRLGVYQVLVTNPLFAPKTQQGLQALHGLTKWLIDGFDEVGLSRFIPDTPGEDVQTPEEENARFLQGDSGEPQPGEDHITHINVHRVLLLDESLDEKIRELVIQHISAHIDLMRQELQQQTIGGGNVGQGQGVQSTPTGAGVVQGVPTRVV